jgi:hypothetical protein
MAVIGGAVLAVVGLVVLLVTVTSRPGKDGATTDALWSHAATHGLPVVPVPSQSSATEAPPTPVVPRAVSGPYAGTAAAVNGRLFMTIGGDPAECSATVITSPHGDLVWTAAHCVYGGPSKGWSKSVVFVPGYDGDAADSEPYGSWRVRAIYASPQWVSQGSDAHPDVAARYDYAVLVVADQDGESLAQRIGHSIPLRFNASRDLSIRVDGYPAGSPYHGTSLYSCSSPQATLDYGPSSGPAMRWIGCGMTSGASGGGWFATIGGTTYLISNTSVGWIDQKRLAGPYLGSAAQRLYERAVESS